jgi:hypothetical protein
VNYKGQPQRFMLANPDAQNRQVCLLPTVVLNPAGELTEVRWSYRDVNGSLISPPAFLASIELRVDGVGGRLYDGDAMPGETSHVVNSTVVWTNVSSLQMVYNDADDNQYVTFWRFGYRPLLAARLELLPVPGPGQFALRLVGEAGRSYTLEYSTTLTNWFTLLTTNTTTGTNLDLVDTTATNRNRFYRVRLNP